MSVKDFSFRELDRRVVYLLVLVALGVPLYFNYAVTPAPMHAAERAFQVVQSLPVTPGKIALVVMDFGPNSMAENAPQTEVLIEHLMRRGIRFALYSQYPLAEPFLERIPAEVAGRLMQEDAGLQLSYGKDWVNLGFRPGSALMLQNIARSSNLAELLKKDARGNNLAELPIFNGIKSIENIALMAQFTSLVGTLDSFLQFFKSATYRPIFVHGCTSITIPQAFIYLDSGQIAGLFEGIAGAAWYSALLQKQFPRRRKDPSQINNTALGIAHLVIIGLVILGNAGLLLRRKND